MIDAFNEYEPALDQYLRDIGSYPVLSHAEEYALFERFAQGDETARQTLIECNLKLVVSIAKRYPPLIPMMDRVQEGNLGLIRAIGKFDHTRGYKFSTYATWWIRQAISRAIAEKQRVIALPIWASEDLVRLRRLHTRLESELGHDPDYDELLEASCTVHWHNGRTMTKEWIIDLLRGSEEPYSLEHPVEEGEDYTIGDLLMSEDETEEDAMQHVLMEQIEDILGILSERSRTILVMRYLEGKPLEQVGRHFGVTRERIRQIEQQALGQLRSPEIMRLLKEEISA